ncbi:MAG: YggS family pyridoxal phosphate-dependent enzyme [Prevotella sp.]|nr:YggS family pyridoxal phosphate-dependent enzyme [Prevotella sp.]
MDIEERLNEVLASLPEGVELVAVSKFHPEDDILRAYRQGQRVFGESREQELSRKYASLPKDIRWHFIGHLQTNKVKYIAPFISLIEAVDSLKLMKEINRQGEKCGRVIDILLELHLAQEDTKSGLTLDECRSLLADGEWRQMANVRICGLMMMASFTDDENQIRREMLQAAAFFEEVKAEYFADADYFNRRSWGMSDDYEIALKCNSNTIRVGTKIFGPRQ